MLRTVDGREGAHDEVEEDVLQAVGRQGGGGGRLHLSARRGGSWLTSYCARLAMCRDMVLGVGAFAIYIVPEAASHS